MRKTIKTYKSLRPWNESEPYNNSEVDFIRNNYLKSSDSNIAVQIGRSLNSVRYKRQRLGLLRWRVDWKTGRKLVPKEHYRSSIQKEVNALVHFIETTKSDLLRDIANTRRKKLVKQLDYDT